MKQDKVLLIGTSFSALPFAKIINYLGYELHTVGNIKNAPCTKLSSNNHFFDYSNNDLLEDLIKKEKFKYVVPTSNDTSYTSLLKSSKTLEYIDSPENILFFHNKEVFKKKIANLKVRTPQKYGIEDAREIRSKLIVKPSNSYSGKGITVVEDPIDLEKAVNIALLESTENKVVIEDFIDGTLHSYSAFIKNGKIVVGFIVDEFCEAYPYQVDYSYFPSLHCKTKIENEIRGEINSLIETTDLKDGLLHTQFLIDDHKKIWIIECMRRCPGDLYPKLIEYSTGFPYYECYVKSFLGIDIDYTVLNYKIPDVEDRIYRRTINSTEEIQFNALHLNEFPIKDIEFYPLKISGDNLKPAPFDKAGIIFYRHEKN